MVRSGRVPFFYGWIIVALGLLLSFFGIGLTWAASLFAIPMLEELGWSRSGFFFAITLRFLMAILVSPVIGPYFDRRDGARVLCLAGGLLSAIGLVGIAWIQQEWQFALIFGVLGGIAQSAQGGIAIATIPKWFVRRRGFAASIASMGGGLAALLLPPVITWLNAALGWRGGWVVVGAAALLISVLPVLLLRGSPEELGLQPDGDAADFERRGPARSAAADVNYTAAEAIRTRTYWTLLLGVSLGSLWINGLPASLNAMYVDLGFDTATAALSLSVYGVFSILTKVFWGVLASRLQLRVVLLVLSAWGLLAVPLFLLLNRQMGVIALGWPALIGFGVGAYVPLHFLVWAEYFGSRYVGAITGPARSADNIVSSCGPLVLAASHDLFSSYAPALWLHAACLAACFLALWITRPPAVAAKQAA